MSEDMQRVMYPISGPQPTALYKLGEMSRSTAYAEIKAGRLRAIKVGSRTFIAHSEIERYVASLASTEAVK